jgi:hypothetical protein
MKAQAKLASLRSYIDIILKINGELCETLLTREAAKREVMRLTHAITPPRYSWPKEVPYHDILQAVNETAKWTAEAAAERASLKVTESALNNVIRAISPPPSRSRSRSRSQSLGARNCESNMTTAARSSLDESDTDDSGALRRGRSVNRSLKFSTSNHSKAITSHGLRIYMDEENENDLGDNTLDSGDESVPSDAEINTDTVHRYHKYQKSLQELLQNDVSAKKSKTSKRKVKKRGQKSYSTLSLNSVDSASVTKKNTAENASSLQRFLSAMRRKKSLQTVISRQAAVTNATRLAAAASAASNSVKIANINTNSASLLHRNTSASLHNRKVKAKVEELPVTSKVVFVPSSTTGSNEFNIVASVSRASRAAKELNATVASRVKSLHSGGTGELFEEIPRITLADLQHQLKAVKELRKSFEG